MCPHYTSPPSEHKLNHPGHRLPHQGTEQQQQPPRHGDPPRPRHQGQLDHGVMVILGQSIKIMGTFATCIHIIYHSRYFLERICDKRKIQSKILLYYSVIFIYFISKLLCCSYIVYFEALLITTYLVLEIQLHTLLADLRDDLLLRQAAADELQRGEHLQMENLVTGYSCFQLSSRTVVHT